MKNLNKTILGLFISMSAFVNAQDTNYNNTIKIGINGGMSVPKENASGSVGVDLSYQLLVVPGFGLGVATGYNQFLGTENGAIKNHDFGVVPVAALLRYYPKQTGFYVGTDVGYGFITGDSKVASNAATSRPEGGLYLKPELGYHNMDWNFALQYTKVFTGTTGTIGSQEYNISTVGLGVSYNLPLGK